MYSQKLPTNITTTDLALSKLNEEIRNLIGQYLGAYEASLQISSREYFANCIEEFFASYSVAMNECSSSIRNIAYRIKRHMKATLMNFYDYIVRGLWLLKQSPKCKEQLEDCLNTGMVVSVKRSKVLDELYAKYKNKQLPCITKTYKGVEYAVRQTDLGSTIDNGFGGIAGCIKDASISRCINFGSLNETDYPGGIAGEVRDNVTISDCLSDFSSPSGVYGVIGSEDGNNVKITNCVDASGKTSYPGSNVEVTNLFSSLKDSQKLATGEAWAALGEIWEQNIGNETHPILGNKGIYHTRNISNQYGTICLPFKVVSDENIRYYTL